MLLELQYSFDTELHKPELCSESNGLVQKSKVEL